MQHSATQCKSMTCNSMISKQFDTIPYKSMQIKFIQYDSLQLDAIQKIESHWTPFNAIQCNSMQFNANICNSIWQFSCKFKSIVIAILIWILIAIFISNFLKFSSFPVFIFLNLSIFIVFYFPNSSYFFFCEFSEVFLIFYSCVLPTFFSSSILYSNVSSIFPQIYLQMFRQNVLHVKMFFKEQALLLIDKWSSIGQSLEGLYVSKLGDSSQAQTTTALYD